MFHQTLDVGQAGDQLGALIKGVKRDEVKRGMVIAKPGTLKLANRVVAQVCDVSEVCFEVSSTQRYRYVEPFTPLLIGLRIEQGRRWR